MTELTFLVELLLNHKLQKPTKDAVAQRIKEEEEAIAALPPQAPMRPMPYVGAMQSGNIQAPSSRDVATRHPDLVTTPVTGPLPPVAVIAQTQAAATALASRESAIASGRSGKPEPGRTSPRKF